MSSGEFKYWAFISYSHRDLGWARWLQHAIETYRLPRRLVGRESRDGPLPRRLHPVFRDQEELSTGSSLSQAIYRALDASRYLIVVASPHAAVSQWVEQEIQYFRSLGRADRILCLIVDGDPAAGTGMLTGRLQCLPPSLRRQIDRHDGDEPIAADVRPGRETKSGARTRLIAGLIGVGYDDLQQRDERRRRWRIASWAAAAGVLTIGLAMFWYEQREMRHEALRQQAQAVRLQRLVENGREEMRQYRPARAAVYLAEAYKQGVDDPALRYWLGRAMEYVDARRRVINTGAPIQLLRFGPDSTTLLTMGENDHVQLWDLATGQRRIDIDGGAERHSCQLSPDSRRIACIGGENFDHISVWDTASGALLTTVATQSARSQLNFFGIGPYPLAVIGTDGHAELHSVDDPARTIRLPMMASAINFSPNGNYMLIGTDEGEVTLWALDPLRQIRRFPKFEAPLFGLAVTDRGDKVAAADLRGALRVWDQEGRSHLEVGSNASQVTLAFDPAGRDLITESFDGVRVWAADSGTLRFAFRTSAGNSLESRLSPDGELLYSSGTSELSAHRVDSSQPTYTVDGHQYPANDMDFSQDGRRLATASTDGRVVVWELPQQPVVEFEHGTPNAATYGNDRIAGGTGVYSHDGRFIATASTDGDVRLWDSASHRLLKRFEKVDPVSVDVLAFSRDDRILAGGGDSGGIHLWSLPDGEPLRTLDTHGGGVLWIDFSADAHVAAAWTGHHSGLWRLEDGASVGEWKRDYGTAQVLSPDGLRYLIGNQGELTLRRTADTDVVWSLKPTADEEIVALAFSTDGRVLAVADSLHRLRTLDAATGTLIAQTQIPSGLITYSIAVNHDGSVVAEGDSNRNALLWWPASQRQISLTGHHHTVSTVVFSPDEQLLLTTSVDGTARLWDVQSGEFIETIASHAQAFATSPFVGGRFSPDGRRVLTGTFDGVIREWMLPRETRTPEQIAARVACSVPWRLNDLTLVPVLPLASDCSVAEGGSSPR